MPSQRPVIGVTRPDAGQLFNRAAVALAIRLAGGRPVFVTPSGSTDLGRLDGLLVTGGNDVQPRHYGATATAPMHIDPPRDALELNLAREAFALGLPTLGICRGMQILAVARGGRLYQDVGALGGWSALPRWRAHIEPKTRLAELLGAPTLRINKLHHQAIADPGDGMRVVARDTGGLVQAIESPDRALFLGVQWHPEYLPYLGAQRRIFGGLVDAARASSARLSGILGRPRAIGGLTPASDLPGGAR